MSFRTHNFAFKFTARNYREAQEIKDIIDYIKIGTLPRIQSGELNKKFINKNKKYEAWGKQKERDETDVFGTDWFKQDAFGKNDSYASTDRYFEIPDRYQLRFVRFGSNLSEIDDREIRDLHFKIYPSVCSGININYTPDNQYTSFKNIRGQQIDVPAVVMTTTFTETRLLTQMDAAAGY